MEHLLEILKIVDGALNADVNKVSSYTELLASKLEQKGDGSAAKKLRSALAQSKSKHLTAAALGFAKNLPVDTESKFALADREILKKGEVSVFFNEEINETVENFLAYIKNADKLVSNGVEFSPSLLLYGPPGCGKTELVRYIASELELPLVTARLDSLISSFLGSTAKNLRALFDFASSNPCVFFLDEFDAIAKLRDDQYELGELKRVVVSLLQNIDKLDSKTILISATNHEHLLDPAIWRRFAFKISIDKPSLEARKQLFKYYLNNFADEKAVEIFADAADTLTGAEIKELCDEAKRSAIIQSSITINTSDLLYRLALASSQTELASLRDQKDVKTIIKVLRAKNPKIYNYQRLSEMFNISLGSISNLLKGEA